MASKTYLSSRSLWQKLRLLRQTVIAPGLVLLLGACTISQTQTQSTRVPALSELQRNDAVFQSNVPAAAGRAKIPGAIRYSSYSLAPGSQNSASESQRIRTCYLQHGAGLSHTLVHSNALGQNRFARTYFGIHTISKLLHSVCDQVIVARQETVLTTILEMTRRTEVFLRDVVCKTSPAQSRRYNGRICAYVGHSKGGAVAFNIARRCMQRTSLMGAGACQQLVEIYSAAGIIQGALLGILGYGTYIDKLQGEGTVLESVLGFGLDLISDFYVAYIPGITNPLWVDLSPIAPMEGGRPIYSVNDIALMKTGWLRADFAASGVAFKFNGDPDQSLYGCDDNSFSNGNYTACRNFGSSLGHIHAAWFETVFEKGLKHLMQDPRFYDPRHGNSNYLNRFSWRDMQNGDGLADYKLSLSSCFKGLKAPAHLRAVKKCTVFQDLNHLANAGGSRRALQDIIEQLGN